MFIILLYKRTLIFSDDMNIIFISLDIRILVEINHHHFVLYKLQTRIPIYFNISYFIAKWY